MGQLSRNPNHLTGCRLWLQELVGFLRSALADSPGILETLLPGDGEDPSPRIILLSSPWGLCPPTQLVAMARGKHRVEAKATSAERRGEAA